MNNPARSIRFALAGLQMAGRKDQCPVRRCNVLRLGGAVPSRRGTA